MILCLDCGNSRLKWGLRDADGWRATGALPLMDIAQLAQQLPMDCNQASIVGCNVAGIDRAREIEAALNRKVEWIKSLATQCGVINGYDEPASLGVDRWAALIAARALNRGAALVVMSGTATTIDVLDADGRHQGGVILPGIMLMTSSLKLGTAQLPHASGEYQPLPHNTHDAIISGAMQATLGAIQRMFAQLPSQEATGCLLSGGRAETLQAHLDIPCRRVDTLVLDGLARIATTPGFDPA